MNDGQLKRKLAESCPWWTRPYDWTKRDPDLRSAADAPFDHRPGPLADIGPPGLSVLRGPRRVGKSVEIKRAIDGLIAEGVNPLTVLYVVGDGLSAQDLRRIVRVGNRDTEHLGLPRYWFIDEVTAIPDWSKVVKELRDQELGFREGCVVLTGSSARDLRQATADLADRRGGVADSDRLLLPMGFRSFCRAVGRPAAELPEPVLSPGELMGSRAEALIEALAPWWAELDDAWQLYLQVGGFPRAVRDFLEAGTVSAGFVRGIVDLVRGNALRHTEMSEAEITAFLERMATGLAVPMNLTKVATDVGLRDGEAVETRISALAMSFLVWRCFQADGSLPNPRAQRKIYFTDPLLARLSHLFDRNRRDPDFSVLTEQQVGMCLLRAGAGGTPESLIEATGVMYERGNSGAEVDFVGHDLEVPVECKYVDDGWRRGAQPMRARHGRGVMVTRSILELEDRRDVEHPIHAIPVGIFAHLIDAG